MLRALKSWLPVFLWMAVIFMMSTDLGSSGHTSRFTEPLLRWLNPDISPAAIAFVQTLIRKGGHLTEYAILALLALRAAGRSLRTEQTQRFGKAAGIALLIAVTYAATDEFHQSFVPSRGASVYDVLIDATGALLALAGAALWRKWRRPRSPA